MSNSKSHCLNKIAIPFSLTFLVVSCWDRPDSCSVFTAIISTMGRPRVENKKETKSFRVDPRLWKLVQTEAETSGKRTTDVITEALARHLGGVIRGKSDLDNAQLVHFLTRLDSVTKELGDMKGALSQYESKSRKRVTKHTG